MSNNDTTQPAPNWDRLQGELNRESNEERLAQWGHSTDAYQWRRAVLNLHARLTALEAAQSTTPQPQPEPQAVGVTVEELAELLVRLPFGNAAQTHYLLNHPRLGPLLRGEVRRRVELPETPPFIRDAMSKISGPLGDFWRNGYLSGWLAARAALARQQGVG